LYVFFFLPLSRHFFCFCFIFIFRSFLVGKKGSIRQWQMNLKDTLEEPSPDGDSIGGGEFVLG
jgi:hypothetical protein